MRAKLVPMARVKDTKDVLTDASVLTEEQSALAAGIRQLGNPEFDELARTLESNAEQVEKALNGLQKRDLALIPHYPAQPHQRASGNVLDRRA